MSAADIAAVVSDHLELSGISAILSGGGAVSIYSDNEYESGDLDFVTSADRSRLDAAMQELGFSRRRDRHYEHDDCDLFVEFPPGPVMVGRERLVAFAETPSASGTIRMLTPTQCVKDRLAAFYHWNDRQCLDQAVMVARRHEIDLTDIEEWSSGEGFLEKYQEFARRLRRDQIE
jgi:hypothetical protein